MATTTSSVVLESYSTVEYDGANLSTSFTISKPTGLEVGDLMVACIHVGDFNGVGSASLSGWTQQEVTDPISGNSIMTTLTKVADSSDVSATDFTFTMTGTASTDIDVGHGAILRLSSHNSAAATSSGTSASATSVTFAGVTPTYEDTFYIFFAAAFSNSGAPGLSSYSIVTSDPTWTEQFEDNLTAAGNGSTDGSFAFATAERTTDTATGDASFSASSSSNALHGSLVAVSPIINGSVTDSGEEIDIRTFPIINMEEIEITQTAPTVSGRDTTVWTNQNKNSATWTNQNKS